MKPEDAKRLEEIRADEAKYGEKWNADSSDARFLLRLLDEREKEVEKFVLDMEIDYSMAMPRSQDHASGAEWVLRRARIRAGMPPRGNDPA